MKQVMVNELGQKKIVQEGFSWTVLLFGPFVPLIRGDIKWFLIMLPIFFLTAGISDFVFCFIYNNKYIKDLLEKGYVFERDILLKKEKEVEEARKKAIQEKEKIRIREEQRFNNANKTYVAGSSFRQNEIKKFVKAYCGYYDIEKYEGYTTSEMKNNYIEAWEYPIITTNSIHFEDDKNNIEDPNAIKVILEIDETKIHVGYIPKDKNAYIKDWKNRAVEIQAKIYGGNKKEPSYNSDDKVELDTIEHNFKIDLIFFND